MPKFVKIYCNHYNIQYNNWFLMVDKSDLPPNEVVHQMNNNLFEKTFKELDDAVWNDYQKSEKRLRFQFVSDRTIDNQIYPTSNSVRDFIDKYPDSIILVRENGTFMTLTKKHNIVDEIVKSSFDFPLEQAEILVCENDETAPDSWLDFLKQRFPNKQISVVNNFRHRNKSEVGELFKNAKVITFTTTFDNMDWWQTVVENLTDNHEIIGHCGDNENWEEAMTFTNHKIERV